MQRAQAPATTHPKAHAATPLPPFVSPYSYEWFVRAELLRARGQNARAADAYRNALAGGDEDPYLLARLAEVEARAGDAAAADAALQRALRIDPRSEAAWLATAAIAEARSDFARALEAYERAEAAAPTSPEAPVRLSALLRAHGDPERALAVLERAAARGPALGAAALRVRLELARARGDGAALAQAAAAWLAYRGGGEALLARMAAELLAAGAPYLASRMLSALPERKEDAALRLSVALALARYDRAELLLETTPPDALGGPLAISDAYLQIGRPARALVLLQERDRDEPGDEPRRLLLAGMCQLQLGAPAAAAPLLARVPPASAYYGRARHALARALQAGGLPALAAETR